MSEAFEVERVHPHYMAIEWDGEYETVKKIEALSEDFGTLTEFTTSYDGTLTITTPSEFTKSGPTVEHISVGDYVIFDSHKEEYLFCEAHIRPLPKFFRPVAPKS